MISVAGNCLLILAIICSCLGIIFSYRHSFLTNMPDKKQPLLISSYPEKVKAPSNTLSLFRFSSLDACNKHETSSSRFNVSCLGSYLFYLSSLVTILSFLLLVFAFVISDFSLRNVFLNSSTIKPLIYKIAASWASHEGSILLYITMLSTISSIYIRISCYSPQAKNMQIVILSFIQILFLCFIFFISNPFDDFKFKPDQGLGLNPLLQDKALSIHPPLLYLGYVSYIAIYVNALLLLLKPVQTKDIIRNSLFFSSFALMTLTAGIGLGAWWAYRELGWGGYWFFDPVENISLMPWLVGISLHHFLLINIKGVAPDENNKSKEGMVLPWVIFTSFLAFLLTIYGIFFVRSGIISSVHSFAFSPQRGLYLFGISAILTVVAMGACIKGKACSLRYLQSVPQNNTLPLISFKGKRLAGLDYMPNLMIISNLLWLVAFLTLFIALIYPIYCSYFYNIDVAIDPEYFHKIFIPILIPQILLAAIVPVLGRMTFKILIYLLISIIVVILIRYYSKDMGFISGGIIFASTFLMSQMLNYLLSDTKYFQKSIGTNRLALIIGHFSLGMLGFTIALNVLFSEQIEFIGKIGDAVVNRSFSVRLNDIKFSDTPVYYKQIAELSVSDNKGNIVILKPENRLYKIEKTLSQEADIYSYLTHDMFAVLSKVESNKIHALIYYRPMISFIWLSLLLMSATFGVYIWGKLGKQKFSLTGTKLGNNLLNL